MKRKLITFGIIMFIAQSIFSQFDQNGQYFTENLKTLSSQRQIDSIDLFPVIDFPYDSVRALSEINTSNLAEAYPWISNDGLRLYFTMETDSINMFMEAKRADNESEFNPPQPLSISSISNSNLSLWLTNDELDVYFVAREDPGSDKTLLYHANRTSLDEEFTNVTEVVLLGDFTDFITSPSLTADLEKLYIYNSSASKKILVFKKVNIHEYLLTDSLFAPDGYQIGPGKLGQNDLKYYLTLNDIDDHRSLYVFQRENTVDKFDSLYYLNNNMINDSISGNIQPSISNNGNYFLFVRNGNDTWSANDLYMAYTNNNTVGFSDIENNDIKINTFPNPAVESIAFHLPKLRNKEFNISIFNVNGVQIESFFVTKNSPLTKISTTKYHAGVYFYTIENSGSFIGNGKFVIKN